MKKILSLFLALALLCACAMAEFSTDVEAINRTIQSVVVLENADGTRTAGAVVGEGLILTESAVAADPSAWTVHTESGESSGIADVIKNNAANGTALCASADGLSLPAIPIASGKTLLRGETVTVLGSPLGQVNTASTGTVGAVFEDKGATWIQINASLAGSATGAVMNESGCMVGLLSSAYDNGEGAARGIYYAVSTDSLPVTISTVVPETAAEPTAEPTAEPVEEPENDWLLINEDDLTVEIKRFEFEEKSNGHSVLRLYADIENNTGHTISLGLFEATINGEEADGTGISDITSGTQIRAEDGEKYFFFSTYGGASAEPLRNPETLEFVLQAYDSETYDDLYNLNISIKGPGASDTPAAPTTTAAPAAPVDEGLGLVLCDKDDLRIVVTDILFETYSAESNYLTMYTTVTNNTGHTIHVRVEDAVINGVEMDSAGMVGIPDGATYTEEDDECFFMPLDKTDANAIAQLKNPQTLKFTVRIVTDGDYDELYNFPVKITAPGASDDPAPAPTAAPASGTFYPYLCKGDKSNDVRVLQMRLITLGYLNDSADGVYGNNTAQAVYDFRQQNGLMNVTDAYAADQEMQNVLFGPGAKYYTEPEFGLIIPNPSTGEWNKLSNDIISFRIQVKNITKTKTIKAFELYMYATDVNGELIYGDNNVYMETTTKNVGPGQTVFSEYMNMSNCSRIDQIHARIAKIIYSDGTVVEPSDQNYESWNIN